MRSPGNSPPSAPLVCTTYAEVATMAEDFEKTSRDALGRANEISDVGIFWGLVLTVVMVVAAMIKGMLG